MSESEFKKLKTNLRIVQFLLVIFIGLLIASQIHQFINSNTNSFPKVQVVNGKDGKDGQVDYNRVDSIINAKVAGLPKPLNGSNGSNGQSIQGIPGIGTAGANGTNGSDGIGTNGKDGSNADPSPVLQVKIDPITCQLQQKYDTSDIWVSFAQLPKPCEVS